MLNIKKEGIVLQKSDSDFENSGVLNPAVIQEGGDIHMFYRAVRTGNHSTIGYCRLKDPLTVEERYEIPLLFPQSDYESQGVEDPRIVKIDDLYYLTYTAYDGVNALGALALSRDLKNFVKHGLIVPQISYAEFSHMAESSGLINEKYLRYNEHEQMTEKQGKKILIWDKNVIFFPRRINNKLYFLHRIRPDIQISSVNTLDELTTEYWQNYILHFNDSILLSPKHKHEVSYIGGGCPPIETADGWLLIYHGVHDTVKGFVYSACAALLDLNDPTKEISRLPYVLFKPEYDWELKGEVNNVCFPTGAIVRDDRLYIYYGAADECIACASLSISELLSELVIYSGNGITSIKPEIGMHQIAERILNPLKPGKADSHESSGVQHEVLCISSYPPRECGIATYSQDLVRALSGKFSRSFTMRVCPIESKSGKYSYPAEVLYTLDIDQYNAFADLAEKINSNTNICQVLIQHEFGLFRKHEDDFVQFLTLLTKPVAIAFHTVLPMPDTLFLKKVQDLCKHATSVMVMTNSSAKILKQDYGISKEKITVIPHGTHLVSHIDQNQLKKKYNLSGKKILSTFGLLGPGKSIETTLESLPAIIKEHPDVLFLVIGRTHPSIVQQDGETYRLMLEKKTEELNIREHVRFINQFVPLPELLEYLQLTDIYMFTSKDRNQAISGTFSYALSSGCPIISTPIPQAKEVLRKEGGIIVAFEDSKQLGKAAIKLLHDEGLRKRISSNGQHRMAFSAWENVAIAHAMLIQKKTNANIILDYSLPDIKLDHIRKLSTDFGMIQFSKINQPDLESGYTLDDNARAMIAMCQYFEMTRDHAVVQLIMTYFNFIRHCQQEDGSFKNYVDAQGQFTEQNQATNLEDSNGRAIWGLGYLVSISSLLPGKLVAAVEICLQKALTQAGNVHSTRAMAFTIKGLYYLCLKNPSAENLSLVRKLSDRLVQMYKHEADDTWHWFESYLTYANSIIPEALLCAWATTGDQIYQEVAHSSFDFLLSKTFDKEGIQVISNQGWHHKGHEILPDKKGGQQPIDVAYTIIALRKFYEIFRNEDYRQKIEISFNWFLGNNHLHQVIYNPCTGGCYDGLEENYVNLNQGAESTVSYLMARLVIEKTNRVTRNAKQQEECEVHVKLQSQLLKYIKNIGTMNMI